MLVRSTGHNLGSSLLRCQNKKRRNEMKTAVTAAILVFGMVGCAGVDIKPITEEESVSAHGYGRPVSGYIVYAPLVVVEVSQREVCVEKDSQGSCKTHETRCAVGAPIVLPDYSKPFAVDIKSGFGKAGADISIADGWRLTGVKDSSDNTAALGVVEKSLGISPQSLALEVNQPGKCKAPGLYRMTIDPRGLKLSKLLEY